jgi:hypothetical protein
MIVLTIAKPPWCPTAVFLSLIASATANSHNSPDTKQNKKHNSQHDKRGNIGHYCLGHRGADQKADNSEEQNCKNAGYQTSTTTVSAQITGIVFSHKNRPLFLNSRKTLIPFYVKNKVRLQKAFGWPRRL